MSRPINFSAGPAQLPLSVLEQASRDLLHMSPSPLEMSHRGAQFTAIIARAEAQVRQLLQVPQSHAVLFMPGGGTGQFAAVALNIRCAHPAPPVYHVSGAWSKKAAAEASKFRQVSTDASQARDAAYEYVCSNETVDGVRTETPGAFGGAPLVVDMSSDIFTRPLDVSKYGVIYAGAQKNAGTAGVTLVIVERALLGGASPTCPTILNYTVMAEKSSMYNTPPTYPIYIFGLVTQWALEQGGVEALQEAQKEKARLLYDCIDSSEGFYVNTIPSEQRSQVNVVFRLGSEEAEASFVRQAEEQGMIGLKGHRSVGGVRASLYNSLSVADAQRLVRFMKAFQAA